MFVTSSFNDIIESVTVKKTNDIMKKSRIIDSFLLYNEVDMLEYRLRVLYDHVDIFVIVEAHRSFVGKPKPYIFLDNFYRFKDFKDKIIYIRIYEFPYENPDTSLNEQWKNEHYQRDMIIQGLDQAHVKYNDIIILSDVDEIPDTEFLQWIRNETNNNSQISIHNTIYSLRQKYHCYNINTIRELDWYHPKVFTYSTLKTMNSPPLSVVRMMGITQAIPQGIQCYIIERGGWHLSWFTTVQGIRNKLENFSHQEYNNDFITNETRIEECIKTGKDIMERQEIAFHIIPTLSITYLPPKTYELLSSFIIDKHDNNYEKQEEQEDL